MASRVAARCPARRLGVGRVADGGGDATSGCAAKCLALLRRELFGVGDALQHVRQIEPVQRQDHRARYDRPSPGTTARFVQPRDEAKPFTAQAKFQREIRTTHHGRIGYTYRAIRCGES